MNRFEQQALSTPYAMRYGFYLGLVLSLLACLQYTNQIADLNTALLELFFQMAELATWIIGLIICLTHYKRNVLHGEISFIQALSCCLYTSLFAATIQGFSYLLLHMYDDSLMYAMSQERIAYVDVLSQYLTEDHQEVLNNDLQSLKDNLQKLPVIPIKDYIINSISTSILIGGLFYGILLSLIVKNK